VHDRHQSVGQSSLNRNGRSIAASDRPTSQGCAARSSGSAETHASRPWGCRASPPTDATSGCRWCRPTAVNRFALRTRGFDGSLRCWSRRSLTSAGSLSISRTESSVFGSSSRPFHTGRRTADVVSNGRYGRVGPVRSRNRYRFSGSSENLPPSECPCRRRPTRLRRW
jgi:hypothetical protein